MKIRTATLIILIIGSVNIALAQDPKRFEKDIQSYREADEAGFPKNPIVFTGSSTIRMWKNLDEYFPKSKILNRGFGGSLMSDLVYYAEDLILKYKPSKVFIYEGDNDISSGKTTETILADYKTLIDRIRKESPKTKIYLFSAKPSLARWKMKDQYLDLNSQLKEYCEGDSKLTFVNTWDIMLKGKDQPVRDDIFIQDGLHMNKTGYDLWASVVSKYL